MPRIGRWLPRGGAHVALAVLALALVALAAPARAADAPVVLVLGDSLSAGHGLDPGQGWVDLLARRLAKRGFPQRVVNASVSGDTTAGGLARLPAALAREKPTVVVVELGGNDGLRGLSLDVTRANLERIVALARASGARVLLLGMDLPPNYGPAYVKRFHAIYAAVAAREHVALVPSFLVGVGEHLDLMQPDGIHPIAVAEPRLLDNVWPYLEPLL